MQASRQIFSYRAPDGVDPVADFIRRLDDKMRRKVQGQLTLLQDPCRNLQPPFVKAFRQSRYKGLYELRVKLRKMVRILFFLKKDGSVVLLHGFLKKHARATEQALETARARRLALASGEASVQLLQKSITWEET